jgi:hypothetical protein
LPFIFRHQLLKSMCNTKQKAQFLCWNILWATQTVCKQQHNNHQYLTIWNHKTT